MKKNQQCIKQTREKIVKERKCSLKPNTEKKIQEEEEKKLPKIKHIREETGRGRNDCQNIKQKRREKRARRKK